MTQQIFLSQKENPLDLNKIISGSNYVQTYSDISVLCFLCTGNVNSAKTFTVETNSSGMYIITNLTNVKYTSNVYLPPNKVSTFRLVYSGSGMVWNLISDNSIDVTISPTLSWLYLFAKTLVLPPPPTARSIAVMGLCIYEALISHPTFLDLATVNEVGHLVMAHYLPAVDTSSTYNNFPKLSPADLVTITAYVNNFISVTMAYDTNADNPTYQGPPPVCVSSFLWTGTNPVKPHWSLVNYLGTNFTPVASDPSATMNAEMKDLITIQQNLTPAQIEIAEHFAPCPPCHVILLSTQFLSTTDMHELEYAQTLALITMAVSNAAVAAWTVKFKYWGSRPSMYIPLVFGVPFTPIINTPNFPGQISGHSTFSAAWATMMGLQVPRFKKISAFIADLSGISRLYGGIHVSIDNTEGLSNGKSLSEELHTFLLPQIKANGSLL